MKGKGPEKEIKSLILTLYSRFLPLYLILESSLKNRLFKTIQDHLGEAWFTAQLEDHLSDPLFKSETELILKRKHSNYKLSPEKLMIESGLGLWIELFNPRIYKLAKGVPIKIFPNLPKQIKRPQVYQRLVKIKDFRNLLVHSRVPLVLTAENLTYLNEIENNYKNLLELLSWLNEEPVFSLKHFVTDTNKIRKILTK